MTIFIVKCSTAESRKAAADAREAELAKAREAVNGVAAPKSFPKAGKGGGGRSARFRFWKSAFTMLKKHSFGRQGVRQEWLPPRHVLRLR